MKRTGNMRFNNNKSRPQRFGGQNNNHRRDGGHGQHRQHSQGGQSGVPDRRNLRRYQDLRDKYNGQARDALSGGDRVTAEYYFQHADHYFRMAKEIEDYLAKYESSRPAQEQGSQVDSTPQANGHEPAYSAPQGEQQQPAPASESHDDERRPTEQ